MPIYEVIDNLFLSSYVSAKPYKKGFFIVNCTKDLDMINVDGFRVPVDDDCMPESLAAMYSCLPNVLEKMKDALNEELPVIVHCWAGQQRSACVIAAYLIRYHNMTVTEAVDFVKSKKKDAFYYGVNFQTTLDMFYDSCKYLDKRVINVS
jgi:protein-tyrosine phosphatase